VDELHAEEQKAEAQDRLADIADRAATGNIEQPAGEHEERRQLEEVERQKLDGDRGADVRAEDHADRLSEREEPGRREADEHHRGRARGLEHGGDSGADKK